MAEYKRSIYDQPGFPGESPGGGMAAPTPPPVALGEITTPRAQQLGLVPPAPRFPPTAADIDPNTKVELGTLYRGTGAAQAGNLNAMQGDIGHGIYLTPSQEIARSYGGGPTASVRAGTRVVTEHSIKPLYPEEVGYVFGGRRVGEPTSLVSGNGVKLWEGEWSPQNMEQALAGHDLKAVVGTPNSVGLNQVLIRDPSIIQ